MPYGWLACLDKPVSRLVQGTVMISPADEHTSFRLLDEVFELGCTTFDIAHVCGSGDSERTVGRWMHLGGLRDRVVILGKGAHHSGDRQRVTPADISADLLGSLGRFSFHKIDLYVLHRDNQVVPVGPIIEVLNKYRRAGLIRAFGASNWTQHRGGEPPRRRARARALGPEQPELQPRRAAAPALAGLRKYRRTRGRCPRLVRRPEAVALYLVKPRRRVFLGGASGATIWTALAAISTGSAWTPTLRRPTSGAWSVPKRWRVTKR